MIRSVTIEGDAGTLISRLAEAGVTKAASIQVVVNGVIVAIGEASKITLAADGVSFKMTLPPPEPTRAPRDL